MLKVKPSRRPSWQRSPCEDAMTQDWSSLTEVVQTVGAPFRVATPDEVIGKTVIDASAICGTYGMGGPGFFGLQLDDEQWLMLRLWGGMGWFTVGDRPLVAVGEADEERWRPMITLKELSRPRALQRFLGLPAALLEFAFDRHHHGHLTIGSVRLDLDEDPAKRPAWRGGMRPRRLASGDDLRTAWIIGPNPAVEIAAPRPASSEIGE